MPRDGSATIRILDVRGRQVCRLYQGFLAAGRHERSWDGRGADGARAPSGVYFVRIETAYGSAASRVAMVR